MTRSMMNRANSRIRKAYSRKTRTVPRGVMVPPARPDADGSGAERDRRQDWL
jgi:hypothetical protein